MNASFFFTHRGLLVAVSVAMLFATLSIAFNIFHAERGPMQIVGKVTILTEESITIQDARGRTTTLVPKKELPNIFIGIPDVGVGDFVQAFGVRTQPNIFEVERIYPFSDAPKLKRP